MFVHFVYDKFDGETDEYGLQTKPCTVARLDGYCYGFPVDEEREGVLESEETVDETKRQSERELREVLESQEGVERGEEDEREFGGVA